MRNDDPGNSRIGWINFTLPGGVKAMVSSNVLVIVMIIFGGLSAKSWAQQKIEHIELAVSGVAKLQESMENVEGKVDSISKELATRAMQSEVDDLKERGKARDKTIAKLVRCLQHRRNCKPVGRISVEEEHGSDR